ncbi:hypothetical protein ACW5XW_24250 [Aeromonas piscicola]|uniref:hypothetical protein n=1 Tax=Aeromonas piscicola TaxID=600645 RepID=UPI0005B49851|nr:hypothetical protein [Aeromonas piscicola]
MTNTNKELTEFLGTPTSSVITIDYDDSEEVYERIQERLKVHLDIIIKDLRHEKFTKLHSEVSKHFDIEPGYEVKESDFMSNLKQHYVAYQIVGEKKGYCVNITFMTERLDGYIDEFDYEHMLGDLLNLVDKVNN